MAILVLGIAANAQAGRVDFELGGGVFTGVEDDNPLDSGWFGDVGATLELSDRVDLEIAFNRVETRETSSDAFQSAELYTGGLRLYSNAKTDSITRVFLVAGGGYASGLAPGESTEVIYFGPGFRLRAGESSGAVIKVPLLFDAGGSPSKVSLYPTLNFFVSF